MIPSLFASLPTLVSGYHFKVNKGKRFYFPLHFHESICEFLLILNGEGVFQVDGKPYRAQSGNLMCYNRSIWHEEKSISEVFEAVYIGFKGLQIANLPLDFFLERDQHALIDLGKDFGHIKQLFHDIVVEFKNTEPESEMLANQHLGVLMCCLARKVHQNKYAQQVKRPSAVAVQQGKRFIELNYNTEITLDAIARFAHIDSYHFCHLFKRETGMSPFQYLIRYRMEVAKRYLLSTDLAIAQISELVGYKSDTHFQNVFKKLAGISPGKYRTEAGNNRQ